MSTNSRVITSQSVKSIMQKRMLVLAGQVGKRILLTIQGNGNVVDVKNKAGEPVPSIAGDGTLLQKIIFNTKANSEVGMKNARTKQLFIDGLAAEKAGETDKASELFSQYLNATQFSFAILLPSAVADKLSQNVEISGKVEMITTDNGSLLTLDPSSIAVQRAEELGSTTFNMDEFLPKEETVPVDETATEESKA